MLKSLAFLFATAALAGCAGPQALPVKGPASTLAIHLSSDSVDTSMKTWRIFKFDDASCVADSDGTLIAKQILGNSGGQLEPIRLPADENITIGFGYIEARFGQSRQCSHTLTFRPQANQSYAAHFAVVGNSNDCSVALRDGQERIVATSTPARSCVLGLLKDKLPNGQGGGQNYKYKVTVHTVR